MNCQLSVMSRFLDVLLDGRIYHKQQTPVLNMQCLTFASPVDTYPIPNAS